MISTVIVTAALLFWQPMTPIDTATGQHQRVCPQGVTFQVFDGTMPGMPAPDPGYRVDAFTGMGTQDCIIKINAPVLKYSAPKLCGTIAHELGHNWFGLPDLKTKEGQTNIMYGYVEDRPIPGVCSGLTPRRTRARIRIPVQR